MNRCLKAVVLMFIIFACCSGFVYAGEVTERIKTTLEKVIDTLNDPELKKDEEKQGTDDCTVFISTGNQNYRHTFLIDENFVYLRGRCVLSVTGR